MLLRDSASSSTDTVTKHVTWLLICASAALMCARLATVESPRGGTPLLSANDRSRWSTVRALVDEGTYVLDNVIFREPNKRDYRWYSIDLVRHRGPDGHQHYYSSKPTLLTTLVAAPYWLMKTVGGLSIVSKTFYVVRITLLLVHVLPTIFFLVLLSRMIDGFSATPWSKLFVLSSAAFATPLTTFAISLNNHLPAAIFLLVTLWATLRIWSQPECSIWVFALAGLCAGMTAACELPGLSFLAVIGALVLFKSPAKALIGFAPPVALVAAGILGTNYLAHGNWSTAYANRSDGRIILSVRDFDRSFLQLGPITPGLQRQLAAANLNLPSTATLSERPLNRGYILWNPEDEQQYAVRLEGSTLEVSEWNNWYEYPGSYWSGEKQGVDLGEPSRLVYLLHTTIGHHGIFSLTPIWILSVVGSVMWLVKGATIQRGLAGITILLTCVCFVFFVFLRPVEDRNYGGVSFCFRWLVWLIPLWLICLLPVLEWLEGRPTLRKIALALFAISVFSASYNSRNPWSHPWLFEYWTYLGWIRY